MHYELLLDNGQNEQKRKQTLLHTGCLARSSQMTEQEIRGAQHSIRMDAQHTITKNRT
jgi:hypothetical protein